MSPTPFITGESYFSAPFGDCTSLPLTPPRTPQNSNYLSYNETPAQSSYSCYPPSPPMEYVQYPLSSLNTDYERWNGYAGNINGIGIMDEYSRLGYPSQYVDRKIDSPPQFTQI